ncbi:MAG: glutathione S-transferase N-terminal domain-containing protein [Candidatus Poseidoniaceae archaeon]
MHLPILYSFRRCPYAMRARMAIVRTDFQVEHREVILRDRPAHMMEISPKGTVPVLLLPDGTVIEESLEIMEYVQSWELSPVEREWVNRNDEEFKFHLDRYKYPNRYDDVDHIEHREAASKFIQDLNEEIPEGNLSDAIFPFIRQFANHDREWFDSQNWDNVHSWLEGNLSSDEFKVCMTKYPQWIQE